MRSRSARECVGWVVENGKAAESKSEAKDGGGEEKGAGCWNSKGEAEEMVKERTRSVSPRTRGEEGANVCEPRLSPTTLARFLMWIGARVSPREPSHDVVWREARMHLSIEPEEMLAYANISHCCVPSPRAQWFSSAAAAIVFIPHFYL